MKKIRMTVICVFFMMLALPVVKFNFKENVVSNIDNRKLKENPLGKNYVKTSEDEKISVDLEEYVQDRIGFRDNMIYAYTRLNDALFHEMVHPSYTYGKDGYVFFKIDPNENYQYYHEMYVKMLRKIQDYCEERKVPFLFVLDPAKISVLRDELPEGVNYNNDWVTEFRNALDENHINYIDNTELMEEKTREGEVVFNKKYNAGHWNDLGAFYGVNHLLEVLKADDPQIHINTKDEFKIQNELRTSLMMSEFPIHETEPVFYTKCKLKDDTKEYINELRMDEQYHHFMYIENPERKAEGAPKALVFQGSYMNEMGYKFLENSLGEYIAVHNYQNIFQLDYYFNIFKPECVIFETAEYTFQEEYFSSDGVVNIRLNPALNSFADLPEEQRTMPDGMLQVERGKKLTVLNIEGVPAGTSYAYILMDGEEYDLLWMEDEGIFSATVENDKVDTEDFAMVIVNDDQTSKCLWTLAK